MNNLSLELGTWFEGSLGQRVLEEETAALSQILPQLFGYHLVQIGDTGNGRLFESSRIPHRCIMGIEALPGGNGGLHHFQALPESLPLAADSVDVFILAHVLEFSENPHQILREIERALIADGYLILLAFNPLSFWGLRRRFFTRRRHLPWSGQLIAFARLKDWLKLLDLELVQQRTLSFSLPFHSRLLNTEKLGRRLWPYFGSVYLAVAQKRRIPLTPIRPRRQQKTLVAPVRPTIGGAAQGRIIRPV